jgi:hypothetical protein
MRPAEVPALEEQRSEPPLQVPERRHLEPPARPGKEAAVAALGAAAAGLALVRPARRGPGLA